MRDIVQRVERGARSLGLIGQFAKRMKIIIIKININI